MNRLQSELARLYLARPQTCVDADAPSNPLIDASGQVRAMVMELTRPANWDALSRVWQGVQVDLELPAPAIAVSGTDGLQLWFSVTDPITVAQAQAFLQELRQRYLSDVAADRVRLMPASGASALSQDLHAALVPALQDCSGNWSAFLAPDLVPIFAESPWLDIPPNEEGQASLLRGIEVMTQAAFEAACVKLAPRLQAQALALAAQASVEDPMACVRSEDAASFGDPEQFLRQVMQDDSVALALRIEAAKALLQYANVRHRQPGG